MRTLFEDVYAYIGPWAILLPILVMGYWLTLILLKREPSVDSIREFVNLLNTRGGNILILAAMSGVFFHAAIKLFYAMIELSTNGKLNTDNAFPMMALQFVTSSAFGGAFGAMLTMMTGSDGKQRAADRPGNPANGNGGGDNGMPPIVVAPTVVEAAPKG